MNPRGRPRSRCTWRSCITVCHCQVKLCKEDELGQAGCLSCGCAFGCFIKFICAHLVRFRSMIAQKCISWLVGLGVWFSLWVREVPGSNPGRAQYFRHAEIVSRITGKDDWRFAQLDAPINRNNLPSKSMIWTPGADHVPDVLEDLASRSATAK